MPARAQPQAMILGVVVAVEIRVGTPTMLEEVNGAPEPPTRTVANGAPATTQAHSATAAPILVGRLKVRNGRG